MKRLICSCALLASLIVAAPRPAAAQATPFVGQIAIFAFTFCPDGWLPLAGQVLPISQYQALFSLLGTNYGGDGRSNFALPKWGPIYSASGGSFTPCIAVNGVFPSRS